MKLTKAPSIAAFCSSILLALTTTSVPLYAQTATVIDPSSNKPPPAAEPGAYTITQRGTHFRRWESVVTKTNMPGKLTYTTNTLTYTTNAYTELQDGICYRERDTGEWRDA